MTSPNRLRVILGIAAALTTVAIWAAWIVATRHSVTSHLNPVDVGLLRYGVPALAFAPLWLRRGLVPAGVPRWPFVIMVAGSGAPFLLLAGLGMTHAPAAQAGAFLPGSMPLWAGLIGIALFGERLGRWRLLGYGLIVAGILGLGALEAAASGDGTVGQLLFLAAAALWGAYSHAFRRTGLTPMEGAGLVGAWSFLVHLLLALVLGSAITTVPAGALAVQLVVQGLLSGLAAIVCFGYAVQVLGATRAAAFSALAPVLAALGGAAVLGEPVTAGELAACLLVATGVALASGVVSRPPAHRRAAV